VCTDLTFQLVMTIFYKKTLEDSNLFVQSQMMCIMMMSAEMILFSRQQTERASALFNEYE